jgi:hypothetical protein
MTTRKPPDGWTVADWEAWQEVFERYGKPDRTQQDTHRSGNKQASRPTVAHHTSGTTGNPLLPPAPGEPDMLCETARFHVSEIRHFGTIRDDLGIRLARLMGIGAQIRLALHAPPEKRHLIMPPDDDLRLLADALSPEILDDNDEHLDSKSVKDIKARLGNALIEKRPPAKTQRYSRQCIVDLVELALAIQGSGRSKFPTDKDTAFVWVGEYLKMSKKTVENLYYSRHHD